MAKANKPDRTDRTELRAKIRAAYVQGSDLTVAAAMHNVPYATAISWKKADKESESIEIYNMLKIYYEKFTQGFQLMYVETDEINEAFIIFETLNARGCDLETSDLLKNHLFRISGKKLEETKRIVARLSRPKSINF